MPEPKRRKTLGKGIEPLGQKQVTRLKRLFKRLTGSRAESRQPDYRKMVEELWENHRPGDSSASQYSMTVEEQSVALKAREKLADSQSLTNMEKARIIEMHNRHIKGKR